MPHHSTELHAVLEMFSDILLALDRGKLAVNSDAASSVGYTFDSVDDKTLLIRLRTYSL
jgi:hypothetical protein